MRGQRELGWLLVVIGVVVIVLGVVRHETAFVLNGTPHASVVLGIIGLVLLIVGGAAVLVGRQREY